MAAPTLDAHRTTLDDQRRFRRHKIELKILTSLAVSEDEERRRARLEKKTAVTIDISMSGLGFQGITAYPIGSVVDVQLTIGVRPYNFKCVIRRMQEKQITPDRTVYCHGAQFVKGEQITEFIPMMAKYLAARHVKK